MYDSWTITYHKNLLAALQADNTELRNHTFSLTGGNFFAHIPKRNYRIDFTEKMIEWILAGGVEVSEEMLELNPNAHKFGTIYEPSDGTPSVITAYGPRIMAQLDYVIEELKRDKDTRRASMMILASCDQHVGRALGVGETNCEYICTNGFNFAIRGGKLEMCVSMRSNNYTTTVCQDVHVFMALQHLVARAVGVVAGTYHHHAMSGHILLHERKKAIAILEDYFTTVEHGFPPNWENLKGRYS